MRKHFLLLMLMALLPLAGWAEHDMSSVTVKVQSIEYGGYDINNPNTQVNALTVLVTDEIELSENQQFTVDEHIYRDAACTEVVNATLATLPVGDYYLKINGMGVYTGWTSGAFSVKKRSLTIEVANADFFVKNYKAADPSLAGIELFDPNAPDAPDAPAVTYQVSGLINNDQLEDVLSVAQNITYTYGNNVDANADPNGNLLQGYTTGYEIDFNGFSLKNEETSNYKLAYVVRYMKIKQVAIANAAPFTVNAPIVAPAVNVTKQYDGTPFNPEYGLVYAYGAGENDKYTLTANDFTLKYYKQVQVNNEDQDVEVVNPTNVGYYKAKVTGSGNFAGEGVEIGAFTITTKDLTIIVVPKTKTFDGAAFNANDAQFSLNGLVAADEGKVTGLAADADPVLSANVGTYAMTPNVANAKIGEGNDAPALSLNYNVNLALTTDWKIIKRAISVKAESKTVAKNADVPESQLSVIWGDAGKISDAEEEKILGSFKIVSPQDPALSTAATGTTANAYVPTAKEANEVGYDPTIVGDNANYEITPVNGSLTVTGLNFTIMALVPSTIEYGTPIEPEYIAYDTQNNPATVDDKKIAYEYKDGETWSTTAPTALGSYKIRVKNVPGIGTESFANVEVAFPEIPFTIVQKHVTVTINNVTLHKGDTEETLNEHADVDDAYQNALKKGETLSFTFKFVDAFAEQNINNERIIAAVGDYVDVITAELADGQYNDNYDVDFVEGDLTIAAAELVLDPTDDALKQKIAEAAATGEDYTITFANNATLNANEWYAVVLPFATTPKELVNKLGEYVIVNRLRSSEITEAGNDKVVDVKFTLDMKEIPAGEPFLIKAAKEVDWDVICVTDAAPGDINQDGPIDQDAPAPAIEPLDNSISVVAGNLNGDIADVETAYATFTGTYEIGNSVKWYKGLDGTDDADAKYRWLAHKEYKGDNNWKNPKTHAHVLIPMEAYLVLDPAATKARVFVEELNEDGTTAIKSISTDEIHGLNVEGLYNLNGMKMQNVPAQKGVYILNGKKVVIK